MPSHIGKLISCLFVMFSAIATAGHASVPPMPAPPVACDADDNAACAHVRAIGKAFAKMATELNGIHGDADPDRSRSRLEAAATSGNALAMHDLALSLRISAPSGKNDSEAARWYRRAAEWNGWGFAGAQNNLGDMHEKGEGVAKSMGEAIYWYTRAALQGEPTAYMSLGMAFADGMGVQQDMVEACFWLLLADAWLDEGRNRSDVRKKLAELFERMSPAQVVQATGKAHSFKPYYKSRHVIGDRVER